MLEVAALYIFTALLGWGIGAVPTGKFVAYGVKNKYLLQGTGNTSPLSWFLVGDLWVAILAFFLEVGKIMAAMHIGWLFGGTVLLVFTAGVCAVIGHGYSPFLKFLPCRSSSVYVGFACGVNVFAGIILATIWAALFFWKREPYLALKVHLLSLPLVLFFYSVWAGLFGFIVLCYGVYHHRQRFLKGVIY